jgi:hypothetical protein
VIVGRVTTEEEEREREERTATIKAEERRAAAAEVGHADVPNLGALLDSMLHDPCEDPDAAECMLAGDPCAAFPEGDACAAMTAHADPARDAMLDTLATYSIRDPCEVDPSSDECQLLTSARDGALVSMDQCDVEDLNCEVFDPCGVADPPSWCGRGSELEKQMSDVFSNKLAW